MLAPGGSELRDELLVLEEAVQVAGVERDEGDVITYLVQPRPDSGTLGEALLRAGPVPEAGHPLLIAIGDAVMAAAISPHGPRRCEAAAEVGDVQLDEPVEGTEGSPH